MSESLNGSGTGTKKSARQQIREWINKFSDDLANFFGGLFVLLLGFVAFVVFVNAIDFYPKWKIQSPWILATFIGLALVGALLSLRAMFHFARQFDDFNQDEEDDFVYRLNDCSLETLKAIGIGRDVVKSLAAQLKNSGGDEIEMTLLPATPNSWLDELKKDLGEARVEECQAIILKYTRRRSEPAATDTGTVKAAAKVPALSVN